MTNKEEQVVETPVTVPAQVVETPVTETIQAPVKVEAAIPQPEWQKMQERQKRQEERLTQLAREKFEAEFPIVRTDKYKDKWAEVVKLKETEGHRYSGLEYFELLNLIRDPNPNPEPKAQTSPVPAMGFSASPDIPVGEASQTVNGWLSMRYTKEQIASKR